MQKIFLSNKLFIIPMIAPFLFFISSCQNLEKNNLEKVTVIIGDEAYYDYQQTVAEIITTEVNKRTGFNWDISLKESNSDHTITLSIQDSLSLEPEGYNLQINKSNGEYNIDIRSSDKRGLLYGAGKLLRMLQWEKGLALLPEEMNTSSSPQYQIRGHQLGYRNRANSWDAWTPEQFDQYIRELAIFGANSIENIPFEDESNSPHMLLSRDEMNIIMSQICVKYDIDYWIWTPADFDLNDKNKRSEALQKHEELFRESPRMDGVFFPGGDPGNNHTPILLPYLEDIARILNKYHTNSKVWLSLQWFGEEDIDYLYNYIETKKPEWLGGLVSGPGGRPIEETRERLSDNYLVRHYPDITHTVRCQYPVEWWDQAYELTLGREPINPQPVYYAKVFKKTAPFSNGSLAYSDGVHDDVNKVVYLALGWDPDSDVKEIMLDYTRFFFGAGVAKESAEGIFALENNWVGPLKDNEGVDKTLALWTKMERENPQLKSNWRWQMNVLRANYDAYTRRRLIFEENNEKDANNILSHANELGVDAAIDSALRTINEKISAPIEKELRTRIDALCDDLFESIGLQTSVGKYNASGWERGCILDYVDAPLNNREWLSYQLEQVRKLPNKSDQLARLDVICKWDNPGVGSYYDNIGKISQSDHVDRSQTDAPGYGWFGKMEGPPRLSTKVSIEQPILNYDGLDPNANYMLRAAGYGEALLRVNGEKVEPTIYNKGYEEFKEFIIPKALYKDGTITVTWDKPDESHLNWRYQSFVSDVWLLKL